MPAALLERSSATACVMSNQDIKAVGGATHRQGMLLSTWFPCDQTDAIIRTFDLRQHVSRTLADGHLSSLFGRVCLEAKTSALPFLIMSVMAYLFGNNATGTLLSSEASSSLILGSIVIVLKFSPGTYGSNVVLHLYV